MRQTTPVPGNGRGAGPTTVGSSTTAPRSTTYKAPPSGANLTSTGRFGPTRAAPPELRPGRRHGDVPGQRAVGHVPALHGAGAQAQLLGDVLAPAPAVGKA